MEGVNFRKGLKVWMVWMDGMCECQERMEYVNVKKIWNVWMLRKDGMCEY